MRNTFLLLVMIAGFHSGVFCQTQIRSAQMQLDSLARAVNSGQYDGINSILISHRGKTVYERYFGGWTKDSLHDSRSAFKSLTGLLTGIAIDRGYIKDVHQEVYSFFPEYRSFTGKDSLKRNMTIKDLLNMTAGLDCEEFNDGKDCESDMCLTKDWVKFSLAIPLKNAPGTVWAYNSSAPVILGDVVSRAAGMSIMEFAKRFLFTPLGITRYRWTIDPAGHGMTAGSFYILPADMLKIGEMVRQQGKWSGKQIVSAAWIKTSMLTPIAISDFSFMKYSRSAVGIPQPTYYGYYWYKERIATTTYQHDVWFASGNGGQYLFIVPDIELVVVFMQSNYNSWKAKKAFDLLARYILPGFVPIRSAKIK